MSTDPRTPDLYGQAEQRIRHAVATFGSVSVPDLRPMWPVSRPLLSAVLDRMVDEGVLTLENCVVTRNIANNGGGIWSRNGTLTIVNCTISHNVADRIENRRVPNSMDIQSCGSGGGIKIVRGDELVV